MTLLLAVALVLALLLLFVSFFFGYGAGLSEAKNELYEVQLEAARTESKLNGLLLDAALEITETAKVSGLPLTPAQFQAESAALDAAFAGLWEVSALAEGGGHDWLWDED